MSRGDPPGMPECVKTRHGRPGFSLVEVLVAMLALVVGMAAVVGLGRVSARQDTFDELAVALEQRAVGQLALVAAAPFDTLARWARSGGVVPPESAVTRGAGPPRDDGAVRSIRADVVLLEEGLARVGVEIRWTMPGDRATAPSAIRVERLVARTDLAMEAPGALAY
ncbi:MAG: prepilin-type N-terminal cleavage/methylation domain-containing protein [Candidatus Riflebacteria bacterium]|nr:prepilin-type N-terminal cleavage/methylation domain-containing protein [Candidatus Riflebacteria bacterium]